VPKIVLLALAGFGAVPIVHVAAAAVRVGPRAVAGRRVPAARRTVRTEPLVTA
jgi:hypothetical protein